uniref:Uncharacterized protein n=1 Tax=Sphaerodactylus townsendi TaxID=933632 RepID=A0ACB8E9N1_9SAUR
MLSWQRGIFLNKVSSSQFGLLATTEVTRDTCVWEDRGPSAFLRAGTLQPESAPPSVSAFEPAAAAAAGTPLEWGDPFDAFATSRLRPEAQTDPPEDTSPPQISAGLPLRWPREAEGSPGTALEETLAGGGSLGKEPWGTSLESSPGPPPLQGAGGPLGACEEDARLHWKEAEVANSGGGGQQASPVEAPATVSGAALPLSSALGSSVSPLGSLERCPLWAPTESRRERPAVLPLGTAHTSEPETGEDASAGTCGWDPARQEPAALQMPPEEANRLGGSAEEGRGLPLESWEPRGAGRQATEAAPAKPPRTFSSLSLEEEANRALGGTQARCGSREGPGGAADGQGPPVDDGSTPGVIGAGGGNVGRGTERRLLPAADDSPARANELTRQAGSLGDLVRAANEGAGGAKQLETCPGKPGLEGGGGEPCEGLSSDTRPEEGGLGPFGPPPEPSPSVLFWTALEEQLLQSWAGASPEQPRGLGEGPLDHRPGLEQGDRAALTSSPEADPAASHSSRAPLALSASPRVLVSGGLRQGPRGSSSASDSELSSSWSDDRVVDFKKANFWQAERGEEEGSPSGNPFVSRVSPQKNPFVETFQVSLAAGPSLRDHHSEAAPQGLLPATLLCDQPAAPFPHDHQPLAFSTPSLEEEAAVSSGEFDFPSPIVPPATREGSAASSLLAARLSLALPAPSSDAAASSVSPMETRTAEEVPAQRTTRCSPVAIDSECPCRHEMLVGHHGHCATEAPPSGASPQLWWPTQLSFVLVETPHPVKPISASRPAEKQRRASLPLGQDKLKPKPTSGSNSGTPILPLEKTDLKRDPSLPDCSAKYYHLTHDELIQLLLKREAELSKSQEHIRELESYIDRLLVRIMEQSPTLLQVSLAGGPKAAK